MKLTESGLKAFHNYDLKLGQKLMDIRTMLQLEERLPRKYKKKVKKILEAGIEKRRMYKSALFGYRYGMSAEQISKNLFKK